MKSIKKRLFRNKGFTLVEIVMAIVITAAVSIPVSVLIVQHIEAVAVSRDFSIALNLARFEMERVSSMAFEDIISEEISNYSGYPCDIIRTVSYVSGGDSTAESLKEVRVEARRPGESSAIVIFITYIARNVSYGV